MSNDVGAFYWLNCLHWFRNKKKLEFHKKVCKNKVSCGAVIPSEDSSKMLEINQSGNLMRCLLFFMQILIKRTDKCKI